MNKIVKAVKEGQEIETKNLFNVVNDFYLTRLRVSKDGESVVSMQVNVCEEHAEEYEFLQSCTMFDDVAYHLRKADIDSVTSEYNAKVDTLYVTCELKNGLTVLLMIINITGREIVNIYDFTEICSEMDSKLEDFGINPRFEKAEIMDEIILNWSGYTEEEKKKLSSLIRTKMDDDIIVNLMEKTSNLASETEQLKETIRRMDLSLLCLKGEVRRSI